jgi:hypothetical protein
MSQKETSEVRACISILDYKRLVKQASTQGLTVGQVLSDFFENFFADKVDSHPLQEIGKTHHIE